MTARRTIPRRDDRSRAPLSFAQWRLWFVHQLDPSATSSNTSLALRLVGSLDVPALERALAAVVARHDALRTRVTVGADDVPVQIVEPATTVPIAALDLQRVPPVDREAELHRRLAAEACRPFDLGRAPLLRVTVVRLGASDHALLLVVHHIVCDAWSRGLLRRELAAEYRAAMAGTPSPVEDPPIQFGDYAAWQRADADTTAADEAWWVAALAGAPLALALPPARRSTTTPRVRAAIVAAPLQPALVDAVRAAARRAGVTPFMVLLSAYEAVLARCTGMDDFLIGVVMSGRTRTETERVVGCFVNTLPLRARTAGDPSLGALLERVRSATAQALAHQAVPFERLVERLNPARYAGEAPLVQATFNFRNVPASDAIMPGLAVSQMAVQAQPQTAGLSLDVDADAAGMRCTLSYDADRFTPDVAEALLADFRAALEALVSAPVRPLSSLPASRAWRAPHQGTAGAGAAFEALYVRSNLTATQLLMWVHEQRHPGIPLYNLATLRALKTALDPAAFQRAFATLVARSEALRSTIVERDGAPCRTVQPADVHEPALELLDLADQPDPLGAARTWAAARTAVPLDLSRRTYHGALMRLGPEATAWYFLTHHVVSDGWLRAQQQRELFDDYAHECGGTAPARPAPLPFAGVVAAERAAVDSPAGHAADEFWAAARAARGDPVRPYGHVARDGVGPVCRVSLALGAERSARLYTLAGRAEVSGTSAHVAAANLCAAALSGFLHRVGGGGDVTLGIPMHDRRTQALRDTHGLVMAMVPVRVPVHADDTFAALARAAADATAAARPHARHPAAVLAAAGIDAVFNFHVPAPRADAAAHHEWLHPGWAAETLAVSLHDFLGAGALSLTLDFRADVFDAPTRALAERHVLAMLDAMLEDPEARVGDVGLLTPEERERVLVTPNATAVELPDVATVDELVFRQCHATPDAVAVCQPATDGAPPRTLTYAALEADVARLADRLRALGVEHGDCVGLLLGRSTELVVAMLATMRVGAAYVPLDPAYPAERLGVMAAEAGLALCLTTRALLHRLPRQVSRSECVDAPADGRGESTLAPVASPGREDLAYVLFTSGSTGTPKGVEITHAALLNFVTFVGRTFALGPGDRILQFASPSFDVAAEEIFPALACGATVVPRDEAMLDSLPRFVARCGEWGITVLDLPTAFWHELVQALAAGLVALPACVRLVLVGGERMRADRLAEWRRTVGEQVRLWNGYGPTETTVSSTFRDVSAEPAVLASGVVPIGGPIDNTRVYVLDTAMRPAPVGVPGELYIGGIGLACGYRGQPALTAERFIRAPFAPGERLYRTGDIARVTADGELEVIGRLDAQVKVRGFRVEPGEVEEALTALPGVREAAVVARDEGGAGTWLVAYVTASRGAPPAPALREAVIEALHRRLPAYMVPAAVIVLSALPRMPNGKLDRRALPTPDAASVGGAKHVPPRTPVERVIAAIWAEVLGVPRVGAEDNFFQLGGHSLIALRVIARVHDALGAMLPVRALFEAPTVAGLAPAVTACLARAHAAGGSDAELEALLADVEALPDAEAERVAAELDAARGASG